MAINCDNAHFFFYTYYNSRIQHIPFTCSSPIFFLRLIQHFEIVLFYEQ